MRGALIDSLRRISFQRMAYVTVGELKSKQAASYAACCMDRARLAAPRTSALAELLATACAVQSDLLALDFARVARDEAGTAQVGLEGRVVVDQRTGDAVAHRAGLAGLAAAVHVDLDVEGRVVGREHQRLLDDHDRRLAAEVLLYRLAVDEDLSRALLDEDTCHRRLAAAGSVIPVSDHRQSLDLEHFGLLGGVRMRGTGIHLQLLDHRIAERSLGQHALDRLLERAARMLGLHVLELGRVDAARMASVAVVDLVVGLVAGDADLFGVDDDDEIAGIDVRRINGLVLAAQAEGDFTGHPSEDLVGRVNHKPLMRHFGRLGAEGLHGWNRVGFSALDLLSVPLLLMAASQADRCLCKSLCKFRPGLESGKALDCSKEARARDLPAAARQPRVWHKLGLTRSPEEGP